MGQAPSAPELTKTFHAGENKRCAYVVASMQGWRDSMEDAHSTLLRLDDATDDNNNDDETTHNAFFAVYDGHADEGTISSFASANVWRKLKDHEAYKRKEYAYALETAFVETDAAIRANNLGQEAGGATAISILYTSDEELYVANAGDSRCVLSSRGVATQLSIDHRPNLEGEKARIISAGGFVTEDNRVNGLLAPARALGDFFYKQRPDLDPKDQIVTAFPEVKTHSVTADDEFIVLACDGIWDVLSSQQVIDAVRRQIASGASLQECTEYLLEACLAPQFGGVGCDNMTVVIIALLRGRSIDEWRATIAQRVAQGDGHPTPEELPRFFSPDAQREAKIHWENVRNREQEEGGRGEGAGHAFTPAMQMRLLRAAMAQGTQGVMFS